MDRVELRRLAIVTAPGLALVLAIVALVVALGERGDGAGGDSGAPRIGDHWHAPYAVFLCGQRQEPLPGLDHIYGIHTHGDGIIHMHPFAPEGEGSGASVGRFFDYSGGWFDFILAPEDCAAGEPRVLRADSGFHPLGSGFADAIRTCNAKPASEFEEVNADYVPHDGDCIRIVFGPADS